jgi:integrase
MNELRATVADYLAIRRTLGFKLEEPGHLLPQFVDFVERAGSGIVTTELAVTWAKQPQDGHPNQWSRRLSAVRCFARHLQTLDPRTEVPPPDLLPMQPRRATPFLYSEADIAKLMKATQALRSPLPAATYTTFIGLLAVTGMRAGEALRLDQNDLDEANGLLTIRNSKFGKSREVPLHPSTVEALQTYARLRDQLFLRPTTSSFFVSTRGTRLIYNSFHLTFLGLVRQAGLQRQSASCRPRPHDLRHSFAVRTLLGWYRAGLDVEAQMPLLSTYLGHFQPRHTYWYLSATPELMALAGQRLELAWEDPR